MSLFPTCAHFADTDYFKLNVVRALASVLSPCLETSYPCIYSLYAHRRILRVARVREVDIPNTYRVWAHMRLRRSLRMCLSMIALAHTGRVAQCFSAYHSSYLSFFLAVVLHSRRTESCAPGLGHGEDYAGRLCTPAHGCGAMRTHDPLVHTALW